MTGVQNFYLSLKKYFALISGKQALEKYLGISVSYTVSLNNIEKSFNYQRAEIGFQE